VTDAIRTGDLGRLQRLLVANAGLATARIVDRGRCGEQSRSLLHVATDWPGHFPNATRTVQALIAAGADVNARFAGGHTETPLHWAASSDDVDVLDALLDAGAEIEATGAVIGDGTPLADAVAFGQWNAARRWWSVGRRRRSGRQPRWDSPNASSSTSRPPLRPFPTRSLMRSGARATAASAGPPSTSSAGERTPTGSATTSSPRSTPRAGAARTNSPHGCANAGPARRLN
jgi:hypothetical protein